MTDAAPYTFVARCRDCRRFLGDVVVAREHQHCGVTFNTKCRTSSCRDRIIPITFDDAMSQVVIGARFY